MAEIWSEKLRCSSKMKPRLRAEWVVLSEELCILSSCFLSPASKNSVLNRCAVAKFFEVQSLDKVPEGSTLIFGDARIPL